MPFLVACLLVVAVHLATNLGAWTGVGLIADDRFAVGLPIVFDMQGAAWSQRLEVLFTPTLAANASTALYRPFIGLLFCLEHPWFGVDALGYHAVNSLFHCGTAMLWFLLVRRWTASAAAGLAMALLFVGWPGHSEVTHWISARCNLQATFLMSVALVVWDGAQRRARGVVHHLLAIVATAIAVVALGSKESALLWLPLAFLVAWLRGAGPSLARLRRSCVAMILPLAAFALWAWWRSRVLHTWGAGAAASWQPPGLGTAAWSRALIDWPGVLLAPVHAEYAAAWWRVVLWTVHGGLLAAALSAWRQRELRPVLGFAAAFGVVVLVAVAGLKVDPATLENIRHSYEPALALCLLLGLGVAGLPGRARGPVLAILVLVHARVLDENRESWLRAGATYARMEREVQQAAQRAPVRVFDAPGRYDGALVYLVENSRMLLSWPPRRPDELQGRITSADEWEGSLRELAAAAAAQQPLANAFTVAWDDGALVPLVWDATWPQQPWAGTTIDYARIGRERPFLGSKLPVQVLLRSAGPVTLQAIGSAAGRTCEGPLVQHTGATKAATVLLPLPLPVDLPPDALLAVELLVRSAGGERRWPLGVVAPVAR